VATIIVTWNRRESLLRALAAHAAQHTNLSQIDMIVVDNASTDDTLPSILNTYLVDRFIENHGSDLDFDFRPSSRWLPQKDLSPPDGSLPSPQPHPFRSLTILRNLDNHGGAGGFNAGLAFARDVLDTDPTDPIDFVYLLDDDAFVDTDTLSLQLAAMVTDPRIAIVGARSIDPTDRSTTLESTVYFDWRTGHLMDDAPPHHPLYNSHQKFLAQVGSTRRGRNYSGLVDCDVVAACSLLARASLLRTIGLWNPHYFIYEDDADWCLRARHAGLRVVACMDARIFHRTWHARLSPRLNCLRMFYVSRNRLWTMRRVMHEPHRSDATRQWHFTLLRFALDAAWHRRATHARLLLRALSDSLRSIGGRCPIPFPTETSIADALRAAGAFQPGARVAILCDRPLFADFAADMRRQLRAQLQPTEHEPHWIELARNDLPLPPPTCERIFYSTRLRSKLRRQPMCLSALIIFDSAGDFPLLASCPTIHIDGSTRTAFVEQDPLADRLRFTLRWIVVAIRAWWNRHAPPSPGSGQVESFHGRTTTQSGVPPAVQPSSSGAVHDARIS
jgi:GT2 family glycosyltransferase